MTAREIAVAEVIRQREYIAALERDVKLLMERKTEAEARAEAAEASALRQLERHTQALALTREMYETLESQVTQLRAALEAVDKILDFTVPWDNGECGIEDTSGINAAFEMARAALNPPDCHRQLALGGAPADKQESAA